MLKWWKDKKAKRLVEENARIHAKLHANRAKEQARIDKIRGWYSKHDCPLREGPCTLDGCTAWTQGIHEYITFRGDDLIIVDGYAFCGLGKRRD